MARIRSIKPEFFTSSQVVECSRDARLLFAGLWCFCDDSGIHPADYRRLKLEIFPADDCTSVDVKKWLTELICVGLIEEYTAQKATWWRVTGWDRHQCIDRPTYRYPLPDGTVPAGNKRPSHKYGESATPHRTLDGMSDTESNGVERSRTESSRMDGNRPSVRSFVATDHLKVWPDAWWLANDTAKKLWPGRCEAPRLEDQRLLLRVAFLTRSLFTDGWLADAVGGATGPKVKNRVAYMKRILSETARRSGHDLNELLSAIEIPSKPTKQEATGPPANLVQNVGAMPEESKP